jgi:beta-lactam-binding protein with PASTA domain
VTKAGLLVGVALVALLSGLVVNAMLHDDPPIVAQVHVPNVVGMAPALARSELEHSGLTMVISQSDETIAIPAKVRGRLSIDPGDIYSQNPQPETIVPQGTSVEIKVLPRKPSP